MKKSGTIFRQSLLDFPLSVELGKNIPDWKLTRWDGDKGLRFIPLDDEGFSLRGDKRQLLYRGRKRSHRFTILGDCAFEYDCIFEKEPESNVITLFMDGAEQYDFLRQPDFVPDDFLKGSYAVYKKETLFGQGTGKLCHIHRPLIIDARGRKVWGDLSIVNNELKITIPEQWLAEAKYPVVVDPTVGTTTVGSQHMWNSDPLMFEVQIPVNRFLISEAINGACTAYFYTNQDDLEAYGRPVFYSDNGDKPLTRRSMNEQRIDLRVQSGKPAGWRSGTFLNNTDIPVGSYIWFGLLCDYIWLPRFDLGMKCYTDWWDGDGVVPNTYPLYSANIFENFKLSMYFTYNSAQNYVRTLTQGVRLTDIRGFKGDYKRLSAQTTRITDLRNLTVNYKRDSFQNVNSNTIVKPLFTFFRHCLMSVVNTTSLARIPLFSRFARDETKIITNKKENRGLNRKCEDDFLSFDDVKRSRGFIRTIINYINSNDDNSYSILFLRTINETQRITDMFQQGWDYIRFLYVDAGNIAETIRHGDYNRIQIETVKAEGLGFRQFFIFVKLLSVSVVRDFILRRFLIAREELFLKSKITINFSLESRIN